MSAGQVGIHQSNQPTYLLSSHFNFLLLFDRFECLRLYLLLLLQCEAVWMAIWRSLSMIEVALAECSVLSGGISNAEVEGVGEWG